MRAWIRNVQVIASERPGTIALALFCAGALLAAFALAGGGGG